MDALVSVITPSYNSEKYIGKMLFELVSAANKLGVEPELALNKHIDLFIKE